MTIAHLRRLAGAAIVCAAVALPASMAAHAASKAAAYTCKSSGYGFNLPAGWYRGDPLSGKPSSDTCAKDGTSPAFTSPDKHAFFGLAVVNPTDPALTPAKLAAATMQQLGLAQSKVRVGAARYGNMSFTEAAGVIPAPHSANLKMYIQLDVVVHGHRIYEFAGGVIRAHPTASDPVLAGVRKCLAGIRFF